MARRGDVQARHLNGYDFALFLALLGITLATIAAGFTMAAYRGSLSAGVKASEDYSRSLKEVARARQKLNSLQPADR